MLKHCPCSLDWLIETTGVRRDELRRAERLHNLDAVAFVGIMIVEDHYYLGAENLGLDLVEERPQVIFEVVLIGTVVDFKVAVVIFKAL